MAPADVHPIMSDPFASFGDVFPQQPSQQQHPEPHQQFGHDDPWAAMITPQSSPPLAPPPCMPPQAPPADDPWAIAAAPQQPSVSPPAFPPSMPPPPAPIQQPVMTMQPHTEAVPTTVVIDRLVGDVAPPSPIGDVSVVANENGPEVPVFQEGMQPPTMMMQQQPPMSVMIQQTMQPGMQPHPQQMMMQPVRQDQHVMQQQHAMPNAMMPTQQPVQPNNAPLNPFEFDTTPIPQHPAMMQSIIHEPPLMQNVAMPTIQNNAPANPFGEDALIGQMNQLSVHHSIPHCHGADRNDMLIKNDGANAYGYGVMMPPPPAAAPTEFQAPFAPAAFDQGQNGVPPMMQNGVPPNGFGASTSNVAQVSSQPPFPHFDPSRSQQQQHQQLPQNEMMQAPLSPDPFAVHSPVVSPGVPLSPQVNDSFGYAFSPMTSPTEAQRASAGFNGAALPEMPNLNASVGSSAGDPFGVFGQQALVPSNVVNDDPFGVFGYSNAPPSNATSSDPFGSSLVDSTYGGAMVPSNQVVDDPFGIFGSPTPAPQPPPAASSAGEPTQQPDPWSAAGFRPAAQTSLLSAHATDDEDSSTPLELDCNSLPKRGDYYEARINSRSLGAMFYTARDLEDTLLYRMPTNVIDSLKNRPIVAYVAEESAAYNSGVHLGHCILSVNGTEVSDPEECARVIRGAERPMNLRCFVMPELEVTLAEGTHMVKYDKKEMGAPSSALEWKEKYVVVGGIVAKPWMLNMYRSKKEYDTAVKETHSNHKCSVKVKQFDLRGARIILRGNDGKPNTVNYHGLWHYITILPRKGFPIKISSQSLDDLEPVYAAVRRFVRKDMASRDQSFDWK